MPKIVSRDVVNIIATMAADGSVSGKLKEQYFDYNAFVFRENEGKLAKEAVMEQLEKKHPGLEVDTYSVVNQNDFDQPIVETYSFKHSNSVESIGDKMYFSPMLFFATTENPFRQEVREYPMDFKFAGEQKYLINLTLPDGYKVESLPKSVSIPISNELGALKYMVSATDNQIQVSVALNINTSVIPAGYYEELKAFFAEVIK